MVVVRQCPCGQFASKRFPRGARPRRRVRFVLAADSSRKTSLVGSKPPCCRTHRRRAFAMSGRFCSAARSVFFYRSAPSRPTRSGSPAANTRWPGLTSVPPASYPVCPRAGRADSPGGSRGCAACGRSDNGADRSLRCADAAGAASSPCRWTPEIAARPPRAFHRLRRTRLRCVLAGPTISSSCTRTIPPPPENGYTFI